MNNDRAVKKVIVLVAHGTVQDLSDLPEFLLEIRRGRPAPPELLAEMEERYRAVEGSPHLEETQAQAAAVEQRMGLETRTAMRLWHPKLPEVTEDLGADDEILLVPLAPYSVSVYHGAARRQMEAAGRGTKIQCVDSWGQLEVLIEAHRQTIKTAMVDVDASRCAVILTAHSLPVAVIRSGDTYAEEFESAAARVGEGLGCPWKVAYQSQGASGGEWLGPTLLETMKRVKEEGKEVVVVAPIGFLSEHIETLYDLDIEAKAQAEELNLQFVRVPTLRTDAGLLSAIEAALQPLLAGPEKRQE